MALLMVILTSTLVNNSMYILYVTLCFVNAVFAFLLTCKSNTNLMNKIVVKVQIITPSPVAPVRRSLIQHVL